MHIHILGIGGTFMAGLALLARTGGHRVTGSDTGLYPPMSTQLAEAGIDVMHGYEAAHLQPAPDQVVVGNAMTRGNACVEYMLDAGLAYTSGPQWLADNVLPGRHVLAVAGTHGKTTTASMLAHILARAGLSPGYLIGGIARDFGRSAALGDGPHFVVEADEYDTAFFDKRAKFVHYRPRTLVLNNLEYDHADIFPDLAAIERQFHHLVRIVPGAGRIIHNGADANLDRVLAQGCWTPTTPINSAGAWHARPLAADGGVLEIQRGDTVLGRLCWQLRGEHNQANALAALAAAEHAGVAPEQAIEALACFGGVKRRLELCGTPGGIAVYDDFAHHPTAIASTLAGLRASVGDSRILAVFEPRSNTMRAGVHSDALARSFADADRLFVLDNDLDWDVHAVLAPMRQRLETAADVVGLVTRIAACAEPGDTLVVMSNGGFGGIHARLLEALS